MLESEGNLCAWYVCIYCSAGCDLNTILICFSIQYNGIECIPRSLHLQCSRKEKKRSLTSDIEMAVDVDAFLSFKVCPWRENQKYNLILHNARFKFPCRAKAHQSEYATVLLIFSIKVLQMGKPLVFLFPHNSHIPFITALTIMLCIDHSVIRNIRFGLWDDRQKRKNEDE